eukprot:GAHX01002495.1.p1 GENE.GAHX01002495.1~~GAHX01002495.1.p1  ORF type:complete len:305 (+),score=6.49 GAHX01002495.1:71-985(+)
MTTQYHFSWFHGLYFSIPFIAIASIIQIVLLIKHSINKRLIKRKYGKDSDLPCRCYVRLRKILIPLNFITTIFIILYSIFPRCSGHIPNIVSELFSNLVFSFLLCSLVWLQYEHLSVLMSSHSKKMFYQRAKFVLFLIISILLLLLPCMFTIVEYANGQKIFYWESVIIRVFFITVVMIANSWLVYSSYLISNEIAEAYKIKVEALGFKSDTKSEKLLHSLDYIFFSAISSATISTLIILVQVRPVFIAIIRLFQTKNCIIYKSASVYTSLLNFIFRFLQTLLLSFFIYVSWIPLRCEPSKGAK